MMRRKGTILRILVADDEPLINWGISRFLKKSADVRSVTTAEEALEAIGVQHYDLCFLDFNLPGMTGVEAMKIINEQSPATKVAIMSGSFVDEALKKQIEDQAYAYVEKPFDLSNIRGIVERAAVSPN